MIRKIISQNNKFYDKKRINSSRTTKLHSDFERTLLEKYARHKDLDWLKIEEKIINQPEKNWSLHQMEITGGEPDVIFYNKEVR